MAEANTPQPSVQERIAGMFAKDLPPPGEGESPPEGEEPNLEGEALPEGESKEGAEAQGEGETPPAQPEEVEVEIEGERYTIPKKISDRFMQHADYTRKTMDLAELRRSFTAERTAFAHQRAFEEQVQPERKQLALLDAQIDAYKRVDWSTLETGDLMKARAQLDQLKDTRGELDGAIQSKRKGFDQQVQQSLRESMESGQRYITQRISGYSEATKQAIFRHAISDGYLPEEIDRLHDPRIVVSLWKAAQWDALQASKPGVSKRTAQSAPVPKPGAANNQTSKTDDAKYRKALAEAKTPYAKSKVIQERLAQKVLRSGGHSR